MSTVPHRIESLETCLKTILLQTVAPKAVHIYIPELYRDEIPYEFPKSFQDLKVVRIIRIAHDIGPATKIIPAIYTLPNDQLILAVDDDLIYPTTILEQFHRYSMMFPNAALSSRGYRIPRSLEWNDKTVVFGVGLREPMDTDVLTGSGGILLRPRYFSKCQNCLSDFSKAPKDAFFVDDIWLSGHLARNKIVKKIIPVPKRHWPQYLKLIGDTGLSNTVNKYGEQDNVMVRWFADAWGYET